MNKSGGTLWTTLTLATDELNAQAGMTIPCEGMDSYKSCHNWFIQIGVFNLVGIGVTFENLQEK